MNDKRLESRKQARMAETVRLVINSRERAPRSPRMERALKQLLWRYTRTDGSRQGSVHAKE